uniref:Uncharacterized protein n=1 Tax=Glossina pallidipes TaxID=7398 RepID=A0A1A9ZPU4_GLOPL
MIWKQQHRKASVAVDVVYFIVGLRSLNEMTGIIDRNKNALGKESPRISKSQLVKLLSIQLTLTAIHLERPEAEIINALTGTHNKKMSPLLLSPHSPKSELTLNKTYLARLHGLPTENDNLIGLCKLTSSKRVIIKNEVIFEIMLPLVDQQFFDVFNVVPIPIVKNETLISTTPDNTYLAINPHRDEYIPFSTDDIANCILTKEAI